MTDCDNVGENGRLKLRACSRCGACGQTERVLVVDYAKILTEFLLRLELGDAPVAAITKLRTGQVGVKFEDV